MKKSLLLLALLLGVTGVRAQDDDVYFVPSSKNKTQETDTYTAAGRSSYIPLGGGDATHDTWVDGRKGCGRDVDEYNRRGVSRRHCAGDTARAPQGYDEGYEDGFADGSCTARLVRFWSPRVGVCVSSPYYWDWYAYAYDPFYMGYGSPWSWGWSGWYGWGSWYGWRPYYSSWWGWGAWRDPWWGGPYYGRPWWGWSGGARYASGTGWRVGNPRSLYAGAGQRPGRGTFANTRRGGSLRSGGDRRSPDFGNTQRTPGGGQTFTRGQRSLGGANGGGNVTRQPRNFGGENRQIDRSMQYTPQRQQRTFTPNTPSSPSRSFTPSAPRGNSGGFGGGGGRGTRSLGGRR